MTAKELRKKYFEFMKKKEHAVIPSAPLVPENDPTSLFISAGMQPLVPYLMGEPHPEGKRLANIQRCIRTGDIDEVGDTTHLTFFEMMGYWSLGDYWKEGAIKLLYEFLTEELGLDPKNFAVTCFEGDATGDIPKDDESASVWKGLGIPGERIAYLGYEDNFWGPVGEAGPCGPDTELFVWTGGGDAPEKFDPEDERWMELGNDVFMAYNKTAEGYEPLSQKNVDFGMGFERLLAYLEGEGDIYKTEVYKPIIEKISEISGKSYEDNKKAFRIVADHLKAAVFMIDAGVEPSNEKEGYVLRRLLRRSIVVLNNLGINETISENILPQVFLCHLELDSGSQKISEVIGKEEKKFRKTLKDGLAKIDHWINESKDSEGVLVRGSELFDWYQSYGIPYEIAVEEVKRLGGNISADAKDKFDKELKNHKQLSRSASAGMFKGGLADAKEETTRLHTAAHLLLAALRKVLGDHVEQRGSNITAERLRFDFSHPKKMTEDEKKQVESLINDAIERDLHVVMEEMSLEKAKESGAMGVFTDRYGDKVKVYTVGDKKQGEAEFSKEICGGPHVPKVGELGHFKIKKEQSSSAGVRRIKATLS